MSGAAARTEALVYEVVVLGLVLAGVGLALVATTRVVMVTAASVVGAGLTLTFAFFGAVDVAITQFLADMLLLVLIAATLHRLPRPKRRSSRLTRTTRAAVAAAGGLAVGAAALAVYRVPLDPVIPAGYAALSVPEGEGRNIVNVVLVDFRALDTLGEVTVLAVAALGVAALLRRPTGQRKESPA